MSFHRIAYEALEICNALEMAAVDAALACTGLQPGARALDIGTGNAAVAIRLAERFGLRVTTVEADPVMATLARERIASAGAAVQLAEARSGTVLAAQPPCDLIVAIGSTDASGTGEREPQTVFRSLRDHLSDSGWLLWGDLFWIGDPPEPLRQLVEITNTYLSHAGWQAAAEAAGYTVERAEISDDVAWAHYRTTMDAAARAWLVANPGAPEAASVQLNADRVKAMLEFGRDYLGFGLYLLRRA